MGPGAYEKASCGTSNSAGSPANMMTFDRSASGRPGIFGAAARIVTALVVAAGPAILPASAQDAAPSPTPTVEAPAATPAPVEAPPAPSATSPADLPPPTPVTEVPAAPTAPAAAPAPTTTPAAPSAGTQDQTTPPSAAAEGAPAPSPDATAAPDATSAPGTTSAPDASSAPVTQLPAEEATPGAAPGPDASHLPRDLSPWNMFLHADWVVKGVMIGLAFASVVTWTVWLAKSLELTWARRRLTRDYAEIHAAASLAEAAQRVGGKKGVVSGLIDMAALELRLSADVPDKDGMKERISSRLDGLVSAAGRDMNKGTGVLATIGSTAPFVGLFGTVWGIMNSFIGISEAQTTNLAIVAPGIAEALLATAIGLVAAIPAVIIYNQFARSISGYKAVIADAAAEVMRLVSRDLDRGFKVKASRAAE